MKWVITFILALTLLFCSPKGPQTLNSHFIGKQKTALIDEKGKARKILLFADSVQAHIYIKREEYFGKRPKLKDGSPYKPKKIFEVEHIYYINSKGIIYKYQIWKKRIH